MGKTPILYIDFDGVIHSYISGWKGPRNIPDPPVTGAIKWLESLLSEPASVCCMAPRFLDFDVQIYSSRSRYIGARWAMKKWLRNEFKNAGYPGDLVELIKFPTKKPPANILIDDHGYRFQGYFPAVEEMKGMLKPWNKKNKDYEYVDLTILVGNVGCGKSRYAQGKAKLAKKMNSKVVVVNMDSIQQMISGGLYDQYDKDKKEIYWAVEEKIINESLERGFSVIVDRTNMDKKRRKRFIDIGKKYWWVKIRCLDWGEGSSEDLKRRIADPRGIDQDKWLSIWKNMRVSYIKPTKEEGFHFITKPKENIIKFIKGEEDFAEQIHKAEERMECFTKEKDHKNTSEISQNQEVLKQLANKDEESTN